MSKYNNQSVKLLMKMLFVSVVIVMLSTFARAADIGAPITKADVNGFVRVELIYEKYDRKIEFSEMTITETSFGIFPGTTTFTVDGETGKQEEKRAMLRLLVPVNENMIVHGDLGMTDSKDSKKRAPLLGLGLKYVGYDKDNTRVGIFIQGHYIPEIKYETQDVDPTYGPGTITQTENYYEISTGLNFAKAVHLGKKTTLVPYVGAMISILKGEEEFEGCYGCGSGAAALQISGRADLKDDGMFAAFAGADLKFGPDLGFHMEGRFINQSSLSASLFMSF